MRANNETLHMRNNHTANMSDKEQATRYTAIYGTGKTRRQISYRSNSDRVIEHRDHAKSSDNEQAIRTSQIGARRYAAAERGATEKWQNNNPSIAANIRNERYDACNARRYKRRI